MKTKIKRHSRSALSILLTICMLVSCMTVGLIATDAAKVQSESVGYATDNAYVKGDWDNWAKPDGEGKGHYISGDAGYTVSLVAGKTYEFVLVADNGDIFKKDTTISSTVTEYNFPKDDKNNAKIKATVTGDYTFKFYGYTGGGNAMGVNITFPDNTTPDTWTVVGGITTTGGQSDPVFGSTWDPTLTQNDMSESSGTWTWSKNNVELTSASTIYYKVAKNHDWSTTVPAGDNKTEITLNGTSCNTATNKVAPGTYNVSATFNGSDVTLALTTVSKSTLTVDNVEHAVVTASYNGTTAQEGDTINNVLAGAAVTVSVTPDSGYKCTGITSDPIGATSGSLYSFTLTMPPNDTTVSATITTVTLKKIYFSNSVTGYGQVYAYVHKLDGNNQVTDEYLGKYPGTTMTKGENSNIWYIEVPDDETYISFVSGEGYTTGELAIPWTSYTNPKYYPGMNRENPVDGGSWKGYTPRTNEYTVTDGDTMSNPNLFTGITATMYDYYVDGEIGTANGGWLKGIQSNEYNIGDGWKWDPYTVLNQNLSAYADATNMPTYGVTYPLYFGNLNVAEGKETTDNLTKNYYNFNRLANNSEALKKSGHNYDAVTGLTGKTLGNDTIHYYKSGVTNENGAPMAMFDEDFLSGENKTGDILATILRTSTFPVRNEKVSVLCLNLSTHYEWETDNAKMVANFYTTSPTSGNKSVEMTSIGNHKYIVRVPSGYTKVQWQRVKPDDTSTVWNSKDADAFGVNTTYTFNSFGNTWNDVNASWSKDNTFAKGHTYYEYDSTDGKDNAFITNIDTTNKTATIDYYANSEKYVQSSNDKKGFFPFDYNNVISNTTPTASRVYLKTNSNWQQAGWYAAVFKQDGKDDSWQALTEDTTLNLWYVDVPAGYEGSTVDFCRMKNTCTISTLPNNPWDGKWDDTGFSDLPVDEKVVCEITGWSNSKQWISDDRIEVEYNKVNGYADATNHYAHDQGFGMKLTIPFNLNADGLNEDGTPQTFDFSGDDDLWVFVDGKLVLDLGGAHAATTGSINFNTKTVTATNKQAIASGVDRNGSFADGFNTNENYVHTMTIYYMERGMFDSNLKFGFSFHAIPNMFWVDKKIRTKEIINAGFYATNGQEGTASNKNTEMTASEGRFISNFEKSYQNEGFTVTQTVKGGSAASEYDTNAYSLLKTGTRYTVDNDQNAHYTGSNGLDAGQYPIYHDLNDCFVGQFTSGDSFKMKETFTGTNKYVYSPRFSVWDQANNNKALTLTGDNTDGYSFTFAPTTTVTGGMENLNIKARFENIMQAHTLTLKKDFTNTTDASTEFTLQVLFDFDYADDDKFDQYIAYPLYYTVDGQSQYVDGSNNKVPYQLTGDGTLKIKAGQVIEIEEIPENAKIKVVEVLADTVDGYRYDSIALTKNGVPATSTKVTKGIEFTMGNEDMMAVVSNKKPDNKYTITYKYPSYGKSPKTESLYGDQSYTVSGVFTVKEMQTYLQLDGSGNLEFISDALKKTFINNKAPYEDNFMQNLSFASSTVDETGGGWVNGDYSCEVTATGTADYSINAYFNLPYAVDTSLVPQASDGKVAYQPATAVGEKSITCFDWYVTGGKTNNFNSQVEGEPVFVNAPLIIYENNTPKYFQYWSVKSQSGYGKQSAEYTRCYDYEFNYALFMDCIIEPVYDVNWAQPAQGGPTAYDDYKHFNPELQVKNDTSNEISIAFLENSRNQYNNDGGGQRIGEAADVVYSDFLLNFNYNSNDGLVQLNQLDAGTKAAGLVIEAVNYMDKEEDNPTVFDYDKNYSGVERFNGNETTQKAAIVNWLQGGTQPTGCKKAQFDVKELDNKNCRQYYTSLNNRKNSDGQLLNTLQNRYKVFRAYAYIGDGASNGNLSNVTLSKPVYFTIYDVGSQGLADNATNS